MRITDLINDNNYDYYVHKSPDFEDIEVIDKVNSYFYNGIINIKNKELNRSALKIEKDKDKAKHSLCYYIDPNADTNEQYRQIFEKVLGNGLSYRNYAVIIKVPKVNKDSIVIPSGSKYRIDKENIICIIHRKENNYDGSYEYKLFVSPLLEKTINKGYFHRPGRDDLNHTLRTDRKMNVDDYLLSVTSGKRVGYSSDFSDYGCVRTIVTIKQLEDIVTRGCNVIAAKKIGNLIEVEYEEYKLKNKTK